MDTTASESAYVGTTNTFSLLLQAEELPLSLVSDAVRTAILQKVMTPVYLGLINEPMMVVIVCFLLGQYHVKWSPLWKTVTGLLQGLANTQAKLVWSCLRRALYCVAGYCDLDEKWYGEGMKEVVKEEGEEKEEKVAETDEKDNVKNRYTERLTHCARYGTVTCKRSEEIENEVSIGYE